MITANSLKFLNSFGLILLVFGFIELFLWLVRRLFSKDREKRFSLAVVILGQSIGKMSRLYVFILSIYLVLQFEDGSGLLELRMRQLFFIATGIQAAAISNSVIERILLEKFAEEVGGKLVQSPTGTVALAVSRFLLLSLVILVTLDNLGVNVSGLIAGVGIGGVAIALAVQKILGDLFASLSIALDKPFMIGDFIVVEDSMGTIERVGLKTTRIRALSGELLVFPNSMLLESRIRNFSKMTERRVVLRIGVTYSTDAAKLSLAKSEVCRLIGQTQGIRLERGHFSDFSSSSLDLEFVYWIQSSDYNEYMGLKEQLNFKIKTFFDSNKIEFAFPTQTIHAQVKSSECDCRL